MSAHLTIVPSAALLSARWIPLILTLGVGLGTRALAAQDGQVVITATAANGSTSTTTVTAIPGHPVDVLINGTVITTTNTSGGVRSEEADNLTLTAGSIQSHRLTTTTSMSRWDMDWLAGLHFGGIIGASFDSALTYDTRAALMPELTADLGVSGATFGIGPRWTFGTKQWTLSSNGLTVGYESLSAISLRAIASYRWMDHATSPSFWHGMPSNGGWYHGGEVNVVVDGLALATQVTWAASHRDRGPHLTLSYGFGF